MEDKIEKEPIDKDAINKDVTNSTNSKNRYIRLKRELEEICNNLYDSKNYIDDAKIQVKKNYTLDNESADQGKLDNMSADIQDMINYIKSHLIPAINQEINGLNESITSLTGLLESEEEI